MCVGWERLVMVLTCTEGFAAGAGGHWWQRAEALLLLPEPTDPDDGGLAGSHGGPALGLVGLPCTIDVHVVDLALWLIRTFVEPGVSRAPRTKSG